MSVYRFQLSTRQTNHTCLAPPHTLPTMLDISPEFPHCMEGGGGRAETNFEKETSAFSISVFKTQIIHAMAQVFQGILSTIVDLRYTIGL